MPSKKPNTTDSELDEILDKFATEVHKNKQHYIPDFERAKQAILAYRDAYMEKVIAAEVIKGRIDELEYWLGNFYNNKRHKDDIRVRIATLKAQTKEGSAINQARKEKK